MEFNKKVSILISVSILGVILFDAFQQKFYLDTFDLYPEDPVSFWVLLKNHAIRWGVWFIFNVLGSLFLWNAHLKSPSENQSKNWLTIISTAIFINAAALISVTLITLWMNDVSLTIASISESFTFILFQKALSFTFATTLGLLLLFNVSKTQLIEAQWVEIQDLKQTSPSPSLPNTRPTIRIKIGQRHKLIQLSEVLWFEADDYCVKIHTQSKSYSLRKSLKSLEKELESYRFIRVHRKALLNMDYFSEVDYQAFTIRLNNHSEIPLSKSGASNLRNALAATSI